MGEETARRFCHCGKQLTKVQRRYCSDECYHHDLRVKEKKIPNNVAHFNLKRMTSRAKLRKEKIKVGEHNGVPVYRVRSGAGTFDDF